MSPFLLSHAYPKRDPNKHRFGTLLVSNHSISRAQLRAALAYQQTHPKRRLGQILIEQAGIPQQKVAHGLNCQHQLRSTVLVLSVLVAPFQTAWAGSLSDAQAGVFAWRSHCQEGVCLAQDSAMPSGAHEPRLMLELKPKKGSGLLDLVEQGYAVKWLEFGAKNAAGQRYRIGLSPTAIHFGWQLRF